MPFKGCPFSSKKRRQKSLIPGPLITAPLTMFFPCFRVRRPETQSSATIRLSPERITASSPLSHHIDAEFEPTAILTFFISVGALITVTAQKITPYLLGVRLVAKRNNFTLNLVLSKACQVSLTFSISGAAGAL